MQFLALQTTRVLLKSIACAADLRRLASMCTSTSAHGRHLCAWYVQVEERQARNFDSQFLRHATVLCRGACAADGAMPSAAGAALCTMGRESDGEAHV